MKMDILLKACGNTEPLTEHTVDWLTRFLDEPDEFAKAPTEFAAEFANDIQSVNLGDLFAETFGSPENRGLAALPHWAKEDWENLKPNYQLICWWNCWYMWKRMGWQWEKLLVHVEHFNETCRESGLVMMTVPIGGGQ